MASLGELFVTVGANIAGFKTAMTDVQAQTQATSEKMDKYLLGALTAVAGAATAAGLAVDDALDKIRIGTGAEGARLDELANSFKNLYGALPSNSEAIATAIADLNTRLGLTGAVLEKTATQMLNLARITGGEVGPIIQSSTRVFGDWGVATDKMGSTLDYIFRVSQSTGIGIDQLNRSIVQFGAPLRQMGFDLETSAALLGQFERDGVNAELVMGSLRIALTRMAKEGITDANAALLEVQERIKGAGSAGEANRIALEMFGAKAGPDMAAAIREGRFELDGLVEKLKASPETINKAAEATDGFTESLALAKNSATLLIEPLGTLLLDAFNAVLTVVKPLAQGIKEMQQEISAASAPVRILVSSLGPVGAILGNFGQEAKKATTESSKLHPEMKKTAQQAKIMGDAHGDATPKINKTTAGMKAAKSAADELQSAYSKLGLVDLQREADDLRLAIDRLVRSGDWSKLSAEQQAQAIEKYEQAAFRANKTTYDFSDRVLALSLQFRNAFTAADAMAMELDSLALSMGSLSQNIKDMPMGMVNEELMAQAQAAAQAAGDIHQLENAYNSADLKNKNAIYEMLRDQIAAAEEAGETVPAEQRKMLEKMAEDLGRTDKGLPAVKSKWGDFSREVSTIITNFSQDIAKSLWEGDMSWGEKGMKLLKSLGEAVTSAFITPAVEAITGFVTNILNGLLKGALENVGVWLGNLGTQFGSMFGSASSYASNAGSSAAGSISSGTTAGSSGGGDFGGGGGGGGISISGPIDAAAGVVSMIYDIRQEGTLNAIEESTRWTKIDIHNLLPKLVNDFASALPAIHDRLMEFRTFGMGVFPQEGYAWNIIAAPLGVIADAAVATSERLEAIDLGIGELTGHIVNDRSRDTSRDNPADRVRDTGRDTVERIRDTTREAVGRLKDNAWNAIERLRDTGRETIKRIRDTSRDSAEKIRDTTRKNVGAFEFLKESAETVGEALASKSTTGVTRTADAATEAIAQSLLAIQHAVNSILPHLESALRVVLPAIHSRLVELRIYGIGVFPQPNMKNGLWDASAMQDWTRQTLQTFLPASVSNALASGRTNSSIAVYVQGNVIGNDDFASDMADLIAAKLAAQGAT